MGYYNENEKTEDVSGIFPTLKGCVAATELVSERENVSFSIYAQTSDGDMLVGKTFVYTDCRELEMWIFDFDDNWKFSREL